MTREEAIQTVGLKRGELGLPRGLPIVEAERGIVEHCANRAAPGRVEHRIAWIVTLAAAQGMARVQLDDADGRVLHVERTL